MQTILPSEFKRGTALMLEGGLEVMVPLFFGPDEVIRVDTRERKYLGKENVE